nr:NADH dehydrogenase subunit 3 [Eumenotes sp. HEM140]
MYKVSLTFSITIVMVMGMILLCTIVSKTSSYDREKMSPFECGFDPLSSARTPFSIQFFLIAILFLIFDIEIAIMIPIMMTLKISLTKMWMITVMSFMMILILGLYYEWKNGALEWL